MFNRQVPNFLSSNVAALVSAPKLRALAALFLLFALSSCRQSHQDRPWGYFKLGKIENFLKSETYLPDDRLLIRYDSNGLSVMSTACTYDLTALQRRQVEGKELWISEETTSRYEQFGKVLSGPAVKDLPYYELKLDAGQVGGRQDTLYVVVGSNRSKDWRFKLPAPK